MLILEDLISKVSEIERRENRDAGLDEKQRLNSYTDTERQPMPCHYFDYIVGASTGGYVSSLVYTYFELC
jgi:hypothetical protein